MNLSSHDSFVIYSCLGQCSLRCAVAQMVCYQFMISTKIESCKSSKVLQQFNTATTFFAFHEYHSVNWKLKTKHLYLPVSSRALPKATVSSGVGGCKNNNLILSFLEFFRWNSFIKKKFHHQLLG